MRNAISVSVTLAATLFLAVAAIGQQDNLLVDLRVEPERAQRSLTLYEAAAANNFPRFVALYTETPQQEYSELYRLWTWSMEDPIGAFYGVDQFERLARLYPGYRSYIDQYRIVDSNGNVFYPSAETRRFLLGEAIIGRTPAVRDLPVRVAERAPAAVTPAPVAPVRTAAPQPVRTPALHLAQPAVQPAVREIPAPAPVVAAVAAPAPVVVPSPVVAAAPIVEPEPVRGVVRRNEANRGALSRSILLMIAGLIGVGMISLMLQTPRDEAERNLTSHAP